MLRLAEVSGGNYSQNRLYSFFCLLLLIFLFFFLGGGKRSVVLSKRAISTPPSSRLILPPEVLIYEVRLIASVRLFLEYTRGAVCTRLYEYVL